MLEMARSYLTDQYFQNREMAERANEKIIELFKYHPEDIDKFNKNLLTIPKFPTFEEIKTLALEMNNFVSVAKK
jgi:hypothetical protein